MQRVSQQSTPGPRCGLSSGGLVWGGPNQRPPGSRSGGIYEASADKEHVQERRCTGANVSNDSTKAFAKIGR